MTVRPPLRQAAAGSIIAILAVLVLAADQFTKYLALENLPYEESVHVIGDFLIFYLTKNPGAAFSMGEEVTWIFTLAMAAVAVAIVWLAATRVRSRLWVVTLGLLLGGVLGNLTDRIFREPGFAVGHVIDFINTPWMMPAIYNVADIFIVTMMICVAALVLFGFRFDGTREPSKAELDAAARAASDSTANDASDASTDPTKG
ncbi:signal peptidase II [Microbacterium sp. C7(2022)]|uniref:signal peptidase II n=1 Tax=Microbacterium sp. C7(2022) TaxID=2992759 RepID=UPI00237C367B|nr:signal peptidase II [Microbacterium sp. C7(2022)]MDE0546761.1 signal peptidase II [Microbacterium sp. C7(2022)]